jgi:hypothetical protein
MLTDIGYAAKTRAKCADERVEINPTTAIVADNFARFAGVVVASKPAVGAPISTST